MYSFIIAVFNIFVLRFILNNDVGVTALSSVKVSLKIDIAFLYIKRKM